MKQQFIERNFTADSMTIIETAIKICENYKRQGYDLSLRQLYYQYISKDLFANTEANYKRLGNIISDARLAGLLDWDFIKDRGREVIENNHWNNPGEILQACSEQFRLDTWKDQPNFVIVMVEKQALEGVLVPVCKELDVKFIANKGYSSSSTMYEIGQNIRKIVVDKNYIYPYGEPGNIATRISHPEMVREPKEAHVIYLGDHDPSGIDMTRDVLERISMFARRKITVHRVALNMDQIEEYNPPENPAKLSDSRAQKYIERYGDSSWELDALEPSLLAQIVRDKVEELRTDDLYLDVLEKQNEWREELSQLAEEYTNGDR